MAFIYLQSDDDIVGSFGTDTIAAMPDFNDNFRVVVTERGSVSFNLSQSMQNNMIVEMSGNSSDYTLVADLSAGTVNVLNSVGKIMAALPVAADFTTPMLSFTNGLTEILVSDADGNGEYETEFQPFLTDLDRVMDDAGQAGEEIFHAALDGVSGSQVLTGTDGQADTFWFNFISETAGLFADFGQVTVENYNRAEGDRILFSDLNGVVFTSDAFDPSIAGYGTGSTSIVFMDDPVVSGIAEQSIELLGVTVAVPFGATVADVDADFSFGPGPI